jgi:hypothetical protein
MGLSRVMACSKAYVYSFEKILKNHLIKRLFLSQLLNSSIEGWAETWQGCQISVV